jgi:hypothetical protein
MDKKPIATFTLVLHFCTEDELPSDDALQDLVETARGFSKIAQADYEVLKPVKRDLR